MDSPLLLRFDALVISVRRRDVRSREVCLTTFAPVVEIFERRSFDVEVGASISCAANGNPCTYHRLMFDAEHHAFFVVQGTQWLREWGVNIPMMRPVILQKLVMRDWETGHVLNQYDLDDYEATWGNAYNMFHRQDMHKGLLHAATSEEGKGIPCKLAIDHM